MPSPTRPLCRLSLLLSAALLLTGCVKPAETAAPPAPKAEPEPFSTAAAQAPVNAPSVASIPAAAIGAAERAKARVEIASTATAEHGPIFEQAKKLFAEKKYPEALRALNSIPYELLTPAQEKAVEDLRKQITAAMPRG